MSPYELDPPIWHADPKEGTLLPSYPYAASLHIHCASQQSPDRSLTFTFPHHASPPIEIPISRLTFLPGPLHALATRPFHEKLSSTVTLPAPDDDPETFSAIRDFLYCIPVQLNEKSLPHILKILRAAHRWALIPLFQAVAEYVVAADSIVQPEHVITASDVVPLPDLPDAFLDYFWQKAALFYDAFVVSEPSPPPPSSEPLCTTLPGEASCSSPSDEPSVITEDPIPPTPPCLPTLTPTFPALFSLALSQNVLPIFLPQILAHSKIPLTDVLLDQTLTCFEPHIHPDASVTSILRTLAPPTILQTRLSSALSARATRLLANTLLAIPSLHQSYPVPLDTIAPTRRVFLFGSVTPSPPRTASYGLHAQYVVSSDAHWRTGPFLPSGALLLSVQIAASPGLCADVSVQCTVGACFPKREEVLDLGIKLFSDPCGCSVSGKEETLLGSFVVRRTLVVIHFSTDFRIRLDAMQKFEKLHDEGRKCPARIVLDAWVVPRSVGWEVDSE